MHTRDPILTVLPVPMTLLMHIHTVSVFFSLLTPCAHVPHSLIHRTPSHHSYDLVISALRSSSVTVFHPPRAITGDQDWLWYFSILVVTMADSR